MPNVTYFPGIPNGPNNPSDDQPNMKINNDANATLWSTGDLFGFNNNRGARHKQVTLTNEASPTIDVTQGDAILSSQSALSESWPVWTHSGSASTFMMTSATNNGPNGFASLPGGMLIQWGIIPTPISGSNPVVFPKVFAFIPFTVQLTIERAAANVDGVVILTGTVATTGFTAVSPTAGSANIYWLAIGRSI